MLTGEIRSQIDQIWNAFWSGGISNPLEVIEQITYLLFLKRLDEQEIAEELKANREKKPMGKRFFPEGKDPIVSGCIFARKPALLNRNRKINAGAGLQVRLAVTDLIFGVKSKEAADALPMEKLERGLRILHAYEKIPQHNLDSKEAVLIQMTDCIAEYDRGESEEWEVLF